MVVLLSFGIFLFGHICITKQNENLIKEFRHAYLNTILKTHFIFNFKKYFS